MEKPRSKPEETRHKIIDSARRLFVQRGYFNTSIPDIVNDSEVSIGSIYHHFANKQDLAKALYEETLRVFVDEMYRRTDAISSTRGKLYVLVQFLYSLCEEEPVKVEYMLFMRHTEIFPDHVPICLSEPFQTVTDWIKQAMFTGEVESGDPMLMAGVFMGAVLKVVELRLRGVLDKSLPDVMDETFSIAWQALGLSPTI